MAVKLIRSLATVSLVIPISLTGHPIARDASALDIFVEGQPMSEKQIAAATIFIMAKYASCDTSTLPIFRIVMIDLIF